MQGGRLQPIKAPDLFVTKTLYEPHNERGKRAVRRLGEPPRRPPRLQCAGGGCVYDIISIVAAPAAAGPCAVQHCTSAGDQRTSPHPSRDTWVTPWLQGPPMGPWLAGGTVAALVRPLKLAARLPDA